jgi:hypothetical protein
VIQGKSGVDSEAVLNGCYFTNNYRTEKSPSWSDEAPGGAFAVKDAANATLTNCHFETNRDGGISIEGLCVLNDCSFIRNSGNFSGIYAFSASLTLRNCKIAAVGLLLSDDAGAAILCSRETNIRMIESMVSGDVVFDEAGIVRVESSSIEGRLESRQPIQVEVIGYLWLSGDVNTVVNVTFSDPSKVEYNHGQPSSPTHTGNSPNQGRGKRLSGGAIAGITIASLVIIGGIVAAVFIFMRKSKSSPPDLGYGQGIENPVVEQWNAETNPVQTAYQTDDMVMSDLWKPDED